MSKTPIKHIDFCSTSFFEYDRRLQRITKELSNNGFIIYWFSRSYETNSDSLHYLSNRKIKTFFKRGILFYLEFNIRLFISLLRSSSDGISAADIDTLPAAYLASKIKRKTLFFDAHEIFHEVPELLGKPLKKKIWFMLSNFLFKRVSRKYTVNHSLRLKFKQDFNTNFDVIMNVPSLKTTNNNPQKDFNKLIYLGVVNKGRGVEIAISALQTLTDFSLQIIGEGDLIEEMKALSKQKGVDKRVTFSGYVSPSELSSHLENGSVGLNLLIPESENYKLSLANKHFDYIHAKLPSICMRFPEYEIINEKHAVSILVDEYSETALIEGINTLYKGNTYSQLQENCTLAATNYNWEKESQKLLSVYT
ncbi:MAG: glycosyltransferase [Saprospiraceae bacterium]|nr:glycosyltransferase [Saprospiraceae bacterium]